MYSTFLLNSDLNKQLIFKVSPLFQAACFYLTLCLLSQVHVILLRKTTTFHVQHDNTILMNSTIMQCIIYIWCSQSLIHFIDFVAKFRQICCAWQAIKNTFREIMYS